jgi:hypothetical protein
MAALMFSMPSAGIAVPHLLVSNFFSGSNRHAVAVSAGGLALVGFSAPGGSSVVMSARSETRADDDKREHSPRNWDEAFRRWIFGWQGLVFLLLLYLLFSPSAAGQIRALFAAFGSVKFFGVEFEMNRTAGENVEDVIRKLRVDVLSRFDTWVNRNRIANLHQQIVDQVVRTAIKAPQADFRSTIYVSDLLFADTLCQLLDYYPEAPVPF